MDGKEPKTGDATAQRVTLAQIPGRVKRMDFFCLPKKMSDNKLVKTLTDSVTLTRLAAGIGWVAKKVIKEPMTSDPSSNLMNYVKFTFVIAASIATYQKIS